MYWSSIECREDAQHAYLISDQNEGGKELTVTCLQFRFSHCGEMFGSKWPQKKVRKNLTFQECFEEAVSKEGEADIHEIK